MTSATSDAAEADAPQCDDELTVAKRREQLLAPFEPLPVTFELLIQYSHFVADTAPIDAFRGRVIDIFCQEASWSIGDMQFGDVLLYLAPVLFCQAPVSLIQCGRARYDCFSSDQAGELEWVGETITWTSTYGEPCTFPAAALIHALRHLADRFLRLAEKCWPEETESLARTEPSVEFVDRVMWGGMLSSLRQSATTLCVGLAELDLPALVTLEIFDAAFPNTIRMAAKWDLIATVKNRAKR